MQQPDAAHSKQMLLRVPPHHVGVIITLFFAGHEFLIVERYYKMESYLIEKPLMVKYNFECKTNKQRHLIDALLRYGHLDITGLSSVLQVLAAELRDVHLGKGYLYGSTAKQLAMLFLICFSD